MKKLSLFTVVIALCLGAAAMIQSRGSDALRSSTVNASHTTSGPFRDGLYLGKLAAQLWRPIPEPGEPTKTIASRFQLIAAPSDAFRRGLPLHAPKLETNEEFIAVRAKVRPVILIQPEAPLGFDNRGYRGTVDRHKCLIAQVFGLADTKTGHSEFSPVLVERVRNMEYPQLFFLPKRPGVLEVDSILRLDELQSVFTPHLEPRQVALADEVAEVLKYQFQFLWTGFGPSDYTDLRELVLTN